MKITHIGSALLSPFPWVLVKVSTDAGIVGVGEAYHGAGVHQIVVDERLQRPLMGQDPRNVDKLFRDMMRSMSASGFYQGAVMSAISGIETALWDITGQALGVPIWQLLGGKFRDEIRVYNDCHAGEEEAPEAYAAKGKEVEARGFDAIKFDIDPLPSRRDAYNRCISNDDVAYYVEVVTAIREALDRNTDLAIDAHWGYAPVDILKLARAFEDLDLLWLEDPIPPENVEAMAEVRGEGVEAKPLMAWFDAAHLARQLEIPAIGLGFGTPGTAHGSGEYVVLEDLFIGARTLALTLHRLLSR